MVRAGYGHGARSRRELFQSLELGLLADFVYALTVENLSDEDRDKLELWLDETPQQTRERIEREKEEERKKRMQFAQELGG